MPSQLLSLLLALQMMLPPPQAVSHRLTSSPLQASVQAQQLWWGMLDPEMAVHAARVPIEEDDPPALRWCWSWRSFLAALLGLPMTKEDADAPSV